MFARIKTVRLFWITLIFVLLSTTFSRAANEQNPVLPDDLGGAQRFLAYVSTDKPIYREGENVYLRTVILNAGDNTPLEKSDTVIQVKITGPKGDIVHEGRAQGTDSAIGFRWAVPTGTAGGSYTASVTSPNLGFPESERVFDIRAYRAPRLKTQIEFIREGYGPGDEVKATIAIERAEGGIPLRASVTAIARLDGQEIYRSKGLKITQAGFVNTAFSLPEDIVRGEGSLSFVIEDGGVVETASKSLPVLLNKLDISFYPESGELVAGIQNRVYFQALLSNGKPADVQGSIVELNGSTPNLTAITDFKSEHEGRGLFMFTPKKNTQYAALVSSPSGITQPAALPSVQTTGTVIQSSRSAFAFDEAIEFSVASNSTSAPTRITLYKRETLLDSKAIDSSLLQLDAYDAEGVLIATVWDENGHPLAERLIYRHPRFGLNVKLSVSDGPFVPGEEISIDILTTDDHGQPVEAVVGLSVTDDSVLELIEKRQQAPRLPVMVYLENDVLDLADAHVYLDRSDTSAANNIDLLLGTQGWRRFVLVEYAELKKQFPLKTKKIMAEKNQPPPTPMFMRRDAMAGAIQLAMPAAAEQLVAAEMVEEVAQEAPQRKQEPALNNLPIDRLSAEVEAARPAIAVNAPELEIADMDEAGLMIMQAPATTGYIREFAFQAQADRQPNERTDFTETLYWNSGVKTGARDGRATVSFSLSDNITTFRVMADGYARNGAIGSADAVIISVEPFYITTKMPLNVVANDTIELPVTLVNTSTKAIDNASLSVTGKGIDTRNTTPITLAPGQRLRSLIRIVTTKAGTYPITITANAGPYSDTVTRTLNVSPAGFPVNVNAGGLLSSVTPFNKTIAIPKDITDGSLTAIAKVYPSPLASMEEALNALLREPHGCFEQTSSTNYPLVMAQQYFDSHVGINPILIAKSQDLLNVGYEKLIGFESADNGYEWFGANPAHEALTAYGLMQFTDMAKVMQIDTNMIKRTREWLLNRRDGNGSFKRNERALDSFGRAPAATTDAYIVWALLESGQHPDSLSSEIAQIKDQAFRGDDSYIDALAANILYLSGDNESAEILARKLVVASHETGSVDGATTSITGSGGDALTIETTSLALLAWLRDDEQWAAQVEKSMQWLFERSKAGRFGSTQSTVLALKAINTYDAARAVPKHPGAVQLFINGEAFGHPVAFTKHSKGAIELPDFAHAVTPGQHNIELRMTAGSKMPFSVEIKYNTSLPSNAKLRPTQLTTELSHTSITEGEPLELRATIRSLTENVPTPIAIIGIPAGLELRHEQLKELVSNDSISAYEVRQSELVLYWRALKASETRQLSIALTAEIPGDYTAPASRIYPYYTDEQKHWEAGHAIEVVARQR
ncbi:MAG: MG2 domain-containing protein [Granulosicoccus sp.]